MSRAFEFPRSDEPFDFRRQAAIYGRYRRDYSPALYDAVAAHTGPAAGRRALDVGCGPGLVTTTLRARGWRAIGADFSAAMLAAADPALPRVLARGEALPVRDASVALIACGTAYHWLAPADALREIRRVLVPGGHVALWWRYAVADEPSERIARRALADVGHPLPDVVLMVHPEQPFAGARGLVGLEPRVLDVVLEYGHDDYLGWASTIETWRRLTGPDHPRFLARLAELLRAELPDGVRERNREYLFVARAG